MMTVNELHRYLSALVVTGKGRKQIVVNVATFPNPLQSDGVCMLPISKVMLSSYRLVDGDGHGIENKDGSERMQTAAIIVGDGYEP